MSGRWEEDPSELAKQVRLLSRKSEAADALAKSISATPIFWFDNNIILAKEEHSTSALGTPCSGSWNNWLNVNLLAKGIPSCKKLLLSCHVIARIDSTGSGDGLIGECRLIFPAISKNNDQIVNHGQNYYLPAWANDVMLCNLFPNRVIQYHFYNWQAWVDVRNSQLKYKYQFNKYRQPSSVGIDTLDYLESTPALTTGPNIIEFRYRISALAYS